MAILRNVAKTDTLEIQRQKINQIASDVFSIGSGGSDLSTGNLRLGDGTRTTPSLAFVSDTSLGIFKPAAKTFGFVSGGKKIADYSETTIFNYKDFILQQNILLTAGITVLNSGTNYDPGTYSDIRLLGGTGDNSTLNITVTEFTGVVNDYGKNYRSGVFTNIILNGGSGSGATTSFIVNDLSGEITDPGSNYLYDEESFSTIYQNVPLTGGSGTGATADITINQLGEISSINIISRGINYNTNDVLSVNSANVGGQGSGFEFTITSQDPGIIKDFEFISKGSGYEVGDIFTLFGTISGIQTTLKGEVLNVSTTLSNSSSTITVTSTDGIANGMLVTTEFGSTGQLAQDTTVLSVDGSTQITLSQNPSTSGASFLNFRSSGNYISILVSSTEGIYSGSSVVQTAGTGELGTGVIVSSVSSFTNTITLSQVPVKAGTATLTFSPPYGTPTENFEYEILNLGEVESFSISSGGNGYSVNDILTVNTRDLVQPITYSVINKNLQAITFVDDIATTIFSVGDTIILDDIQPGAPATIYSIKSSNGFIDSMLVDFRNYVSENIITGDSVTTSSYEIDTASGIKFRYFIDTGSGFQLTPNLTLYVGNTYNFNLTDNSNSSHKFAFSQFRDGIWGPSLIEGISTTLSTISTQIVVANTTGILVGMLVTVSAGDGALALNTTVSQIVGGNTIILSASPTVSGSSTLRFRGFEYTNGVTRSSSILSLKVTEDTPNLYYYCDIQNTSHVDEGGGDNEEALITINSNNLKVFGSNFSISIQNLTKTDVIKGDINTGEFKADSFTGNSSTFGSASVTGTLTAPTITGNNIAATTITSAGNLGLIGTAVNITGNFNVGSTVQVVSSNGNITTSGVLRTNNSLNVNNILTITDNTISTVTGNDIVLEPPTGRVAKVNTTTAIVIPSGSSAQRPAGAVAQNGAIRFNTETGQYEGYSATTTSWSSLGGVRDLDGNTYIAAEAFTGANDNTLYFFNDNNNTLKLTTAYLDFNTVKKLRSLNTSLPLFTTWSSNTPVTLGSYVKYRNNLYEVTQAGTTGTSGNEPVHTTGAQPNGTSILTWYVSAVSPLIFEEISELQVGPLGNLPLVINSDLRLATNVISTDVSDIIIRPNTGKRVSIDAQTSLVIPAGDSNGRGVAAQGSIRYSTTLSSFEGYNGTNWTSLGGVKDVEGNTYIIPETVPGANENILYFFNDGENTLRLSKTELNFNTLSTITSTSNTLALNAELVTFDNLAASIDNSGTSTFISSTQSNLDLGLSVGLNNDHLVRLNTFGDIIINKGFGTGIDSNVTVLTNELKDFELEDTKLSSDDINLVKDTTNTGSTIIYSPTLASGAKVVVSAHNSTTNDIEMIEFTVTAKGSDVYHTEYGNVLTGGDLFDVTFDFNASSDVRMNFALNSSVATGNQVNITVVKTIIKK
jgi:hypothetical protein